MASNRHLGRIVAMQSLYEFDFRSESEPDTKPNLEEILDRNLAVYAQSIDDTDFVRDLVNGTIKNQAKVDALIVPAAPDWPIEQIAKIDRAILRLASWPRLSAVKTHLNLSTECSVPYTGKVIFMNQKKKTRSPKPKANQKPRTRRKTRLLNPTRAIKEYSAGGFVYRMSPNGPEFLLIADHKGRWSIAKGKIESEETPEQAAVREITEESGLQTLLIRDKLDKIYFFYRLKSRLIFMTTWVFLVEALKGDEPISVEEGKYWITDVRWFSIEQARAAMAHKDLQVLLDVAIKKVMARVKVK